MLIDEPKNNNQKSKPVKSVSLTPKQIALILVMIFVFNLLVAGALVGLGIKNESFRSRILGIGSSQPNSAQVDEQSGGDSANQGPGNQAVGDKGFNVADVVERVDAAVVSVIVSKDIPKIEKYYENYNPFGNGFFDDFFGDSFQFQVPRYRENGTEKKEIGGGTGFIVSSDGLIITNRHVVDDEQAEYTVMMNDEEKYPATVLARDPLNDIAILKIDKKDLPVILLGDSDKLRVGENVIAIGNALGEFRNTVSTGIVSGLKREITAGDSFGQTEQLSGVIQTDAAINPGNSGGPLLNLRGEVIGVNVAIVSGSQNIGFALPINDVKQVLRSVKENGRLVRPWIGVRYVMINQTLKDKNQLPVDHGALIVRGQDNTDLAVVPGSPADKAGLVENDIILEVDGKKLDNSYTLSKAISNHEAGDKVQLKLYHQGEEKSVEVLLEEQKSQ